MCQVIAVEIAAGHDGVDDRKARLRAVAHRNRCRAVQLDDGRRVCAREHVVQADNLRPVGRRPRWRLRREQPQSPPVTCTVRIGATRLRAQRATRLQRSAHDPTAVDPDRQAAPAPHPASSARRASIRAAASTRAGRRLRVRAGAQRAAVPAESLRPRRRNA